MGDSGDKVGDTCWDCCRLASVPRARGLMPAGWCCGEEPGVLMPRKEDRKQRLRRGTVTDGSQHRDNLAFAAPTLPALSSPHTPGSPKRGASTSPANEHFSLQDMQPALPRACDQAGSMRAHCSSLAGVPARASTEHGRWHRPGAPETPTLWPRFRTSGFGKLPLCCLTGLLLPLVPSTSGLLLPLVPATM